MKLVKIRVKFCKKFPTLRKTASMSQNGGANCRFCIDPKCKGTCTAEEAKLRTSVLADLIVEACSKLGIDAVFYRWVSTLRHKYGGKIIFRTSNVVPLTLTL